MAYICEIVANLGPIAWWDQLNGGPLLNGRTVTDVHDLHAPHDTRECHIRYPGALFFYRVGSFNNFVFLCDLFVCFTFDTFDTQAFHNI